MKLSLKEKINNIVSGGYASPLIYILLFLISICPVFGLESADWPVDETLSRLNKAYYSEMVLRLERYPMTFEPPVESHIMVRVAKQWPLLLERHDWGIRNTNAVNQRGLPIGGQFINGTDESLSVYVGLGVETNALEACRNTIYRSFNFFISCSRPSTWSGASCLSVPHASFVSNFGGKYATLVVCSINNMSVLVQEYSDGGVLLENKYLVDVITAFGGLTYDKPASIQKHGELKIESIHHGRDTVMLTWKAIGELSDYWVRIDAEEGVLAICKEGQVQLTEVPEEGTWVYCYAISPDGKTWYYTKLRLPASN